MPDEFKQARHYTIRGVVQGVGFRPFVYRLALRHRLCGWVLNDAAGVRIHAEGAAAELDAFEAALRASPPPAARIESLEVASAALQRAASFIIQESTRDAPPSVRISPDLCICEDCRRELRDPRDARYQYEYINCTNCGPRYSIIERLPYDRANTSMAGWPMCAACAAQYADPRDRRFHAQPLACPRCGPRYRLLDEEQRVVNGDGAVALAAAMLRRGKILAVKGIGGYHLACDARNAQAVAALRTRKFRKDKPFAIMVDSLQQAAELVRLSDAHAEQLSGAARPIVLARARVELPQVAPGMRELGLMLPYAPLHHLLFDAGAPSALVLTSANRSSEPICYRDEDAFERLRGLADAFLVGARPIVRRVDDSVLAVFGDQPTLLRRSRGYAPGAVARLACDGPLLAIGADLKNAPALLIDGQVILAQHIGDLGDVETDRALREAVRDLLEMYAVPAAQLTVAHDLHPQYLSTRIAREIAAARHVGVQHHHAHVASVLAEHDALREPLIGVALDGTGWGTDNTIWGCEVFTGSLELGLQRVAHLRPVAMPGGDAAAQHPVQAAAGRLAGVETSLSGAKRLQAAPFHFPQRYAQAAQLIARRVRCVDSTSAGRLFDCVAALLGFVEPQTFEGQAAIWLENLAQQAESAEAYELPLVAPQPTALEDRAGACTTLDDRALLTCVIRDRLAGRPVADIARAFHLGLASGLAQCVIAEAQRRNLKIVALSGGVFQNALLRAQLVTRLRGAGLRPLLNQRVPPNDGGISLGQAALAALSARGPIPPAQPTARRAARPGAP